MNNWNAENVYNVYREIDRYQDTNAIRYITKWVDGKGGKW